MIFKRIANLWRHKTPVRRCWGGPFDGQDIGGETTAFAVGVYRDTQTGRYWLDDRQNAFALLGSGRVSHPGVYRWYPYERRYEWIPMRSHFCLTGKMMEPPRSLL